MDLCLFGWSPTIGNSKDVPQRIWRAWLSRILWKMSSHMENRHTHLIAICIARAAFPGPWTPRGSKGSARDSKGYLKAPRSD